MYMISNFLILNVAISWPAKTLNGFKTIGEINEKSNGEIIGN